MAGWPAAAQGHRSSRITPRGRRWQPKARLVPAGERSEPSSCVGWQKEGGRGKRRNGMQEDRPVFPLGGCTILSDVAGAVWDSPHISSLGPKGGRGRPERPEGALCWPRKERPQLRCERVNCGRASVYIHICLHLFVYCLQASVC